MRHANYWLASGIAALSLLPSGALAQQNPPWSGWSGPGPWHMMGGGWGFWWIMPLMMFLVMVVICGFLMMRGPWARHDHHDDTTTSAMRLLNERFAQGLITKEEYEERKATLARRA